MVRALGRDGYGRWWWTFVLLEAATILGNLGADLYVRRELPPLAEDEEGTAEAIAVVGSALAIVAVSGLSLALLQFGLAGQIARAQGDPGLLPFMMLLAFQPMAWTIGGILGAALQSRHRLGALAAIRGLVAPVLLALVLYGSWRGALSTSTTLALMLGASGVVLMLVVTLYARHFPLGATLRAMVRPRRVRPALAYGLRLLAPLVLYTLGGKLDLYVLGAYEAPAYVGLYAACLQMASIMPNTRALFDPIVQAQVGALYAGHRAELAS